MLFSEMSRRFTNKPHQSQTHIPWDSQHLNVFISFSNINTCITTKITIKFTTVTLTYLLLIVQCKIIIPLMVLESRICSYPLPVSHLYTFLQLYDTYVHQWLITRYDYLKKQCIYIMVMRWIFCCCGLLKLKGCP